jgi:hypothetical protein
MGKKLYCGFRGWTRIALCHSEPGTATPATSAQPRRLKLQMHSAVQNEAPEKEHHDDCDNGGNDETAKKRWLFRFALVARGFHIRQNYQT